MKKALSLLLALALLLLSLPLLTGCGTFLTVDFSELGTELDLDAYLATVGLTYQDCCDYPDYLAYYTEEAFLQKLISLSTVNWSAYEKIGEINAAVADREAEAEYYYSAYGGYSGTGGSANRIKGEFLENGWGNHLHHVTGVVSMARSADFDSASSQFFFTLSDSAAPSPDGKYAAFGCVVAGWETVEAAAKIPTSNEKPTTDILIEKITFVTPVTE